MRKGPDAASLRQQMLRLERNVDWAHTERDLRLIRCPVLILWGEVDRYYPAGLLERYTRHLTTAEAHTIPGQDIYFTVTNQHWPTPDSQISSRLRTARVREVPGSPHRRRQTAQSDGAASAELEDDAGVVERNTADDAGSYRDAPHDQQTRCTGCETGVLPEDERVVLTVLTTALLLLCVPPVIELFSLVALAEAGLMWRISDIVQASERRNDALDRLRLQ
jgi:hypothetical protein